MKRWTKENVVREGATKLKPSRRGMKRHAQPRKRLPHGATPDVYSSRQHVPMKAHAAKPCRMTKVLNHRGEERFGVFYGNRTKPQLFTTKSAAERFQRECWRTHGYKGLGRMAKAKKSKKSVASRKARGAHCVYTPSGKLFNCFPEKSSAERVVAGMGEGWSLKSSGSRRRG